MFIFGTAGMDGGRGTRGAYSEMWLNGGDSKGTALIPPGGGEYPTGSKSDSFFITDISLTQRERFSVVQCFDDKNYIYAFGHDPLGSMVTVDFTAFLGTCAASGGGDGLTALLKMYSENRLTSSLKPAKVRLGSGALLVDGFIIGMTTGSHKPEFNLQNFQASLIIPKCANGGGT